MSNELYNTIARVTDGIYEGIECMWLKFKDAFRDVGIIQHGLFQALQLEEMFFRAQLFQTMFCALIIYPR